MKSKSIQHAIIIIIEMYIPQFLLYNEINYKRYLFINQVRKQYTKYVTCSHESCFGCHTVMDHIIFVTSSLLSLTIITVRVRIRDGNINFNDTKPLILRS